jgi:hypothetical protein
MSKGPTFGESMVGLNFNPSADDKVSKAKALFAEAIDLLNAEYKAKNMGGNPTKDMLYKHAIGEILNAQMNTVKILTLDK